MAWFGGACDLIVPLHAAQEVRHLGIGTTPSIGPSRSSVFARERSSQSLQAGPRGYGGVQKNCLARLAEVGAGLAPGTPVKVWFQDEMRVESS